MKSKLSLSVALLVLAASVQAANFTPGNIVVYRIGDGTANNLTNTGSRVFLEEYTTNGGFVQTVAMPTNYFGAYAPLVASGVATTEGEMTLSVDGRFIVLTGFAGIIGQSNNTSLATTPATSVPRVVGLVDQFTHIDTTTVQTNAFASTEDIRSAASTDGTNLWFSGDGLGTVHAGIRYTTRGSSLATNLTTLITNLRQINIFSNALYFSTASGSAIRLGTVTNAMPVTSEGAFQAGLTGTPTSVGSPYGFVLLHLSGSTNALNTLYYADDNPGAIYKYSLSGDTWTSNGFITATNVRGMTGKVDLSGNVHLYITTAPAAVPGNPYTGGGVLAGYTDSSGYNSPPTNDGGDLGDFADFAVTPLASDEVFRGVAFAPSGGETFPIGPGRISVGPINGLTTSGFTGGPFGTTKIYSIANPGTNTVTSWAATADANWLTLTPSSGSLVSGGSITVTVSFNANANSLSPGTNLSTITFTNSTAGNDGSDATSRPVKLILNQISVSPSSNYFASGPVNGPYTPGTKIYTVTNGSASSLTWGAGILSSNWLTVIPTSGSIPVGGSTAVSVSVTNANALALSRGGYVDTVVFTNSAANDPGNAARDVSLLIGGGFTSNNLVIYRAGDGVAGLNNNPTPAFVDEYTRNGDLIQSIPISTNNYGCSGTATAEGLMTRSTDRQYLVFVGYGTNKTYAASAPASVSTVVPRVVGRVDGNANVDVSTRLTDFASGTNPRAAVSTNGIAMWVAGAGTAGIRYTALGQTTSAQVCTNPTGNWRALNIYNNQLYAGSAIAGTGVRIATIGTGLPTTDIGAAVNLPGYSTNEVSPYNFVLVKTKAGGTDPFDTLYVADDAGNNTGTLTSGGAIYKWSLVGGSWTSNGVGFANAVRGLAGDVSIVGTTTNVNLFAVGSGNGAGGGSTLIAYTDTNGWNAVPVGNGGNIGTTIATASANESWRSISLAPEIPATANLSLTPGDFIVTGSPSEVTNQSKVYLVSDVSNSSMTWTATWTSAWLSLSYYGGNLAAGDDTNVTVFINANATGLANGTYLDTISFVNTINGQGNTTRGVSLTITGAVADAWTTWENHYFPSGGTSAAGTADPDHDGMSNTNEFLSGFNPTNAAAYAHVISIAKSGGGMNVTYLGASGDDTWTPGIGSRTNVLEFTTGTANGSYSNNFATTGQTNILSGGHGLGTVTNMVDPSGATGATRYYRIRVLAP